MSARGVEAVLVAGQQESWRTQLSDDCLVTATPNMDNLVLLPPCWLSDCRPRERAGTCLSARGMTGDNMKRAGAVRSRLLGAAGVALIAASLTACSSSPSAAPPPPGSLPAGTATVVIDAQALPDTTVVKCMPVGSLTNIAAGNPGAGVTALVSNSNRLSAKSVTINDLGGFTGSYME